LLGTRLDVADVVETIRQNDRSVERAAAERKGGAGGGAARRWRAAAPGRALPRRINAIGRLVEVLDQFLHGGQGDDGCRDRAR